MIIDDREMVDSRDEDYKEQEEGKRKKHYIREKEREFDEKIEKIDDKIKDGLYNDGVTNDKNGSKTSEPDNDGHATGK